MTRIKQIKLFALALLVFALKSTMASAAMHEWTHEEHKYQLYIESAESYDDNKVKAFNQLCGQFHKANWMQTASELRYPSSEEEYDEFSNSIRTSRAEMFKNGKARLLLIYRDGVMVGGTYLLENATLLRISCAGFSVEIALPEVMRAQTEMLQLLTSVKNFPNATKLITCVSKAD